MSDRVRACVAEFIGTFLLVSVAIAASGSGVGGAGSDVVRSALANGLVLSALVTAFIGWSGAQFNPAVSVALAVIGKQSASRAAMFVVVQCTSATMAAGLLLLPGGGGGLTGDAPPPGATIGLANLLGDWPRVVVIEAVLTFGLMVSILWGTVDGRAHKLGGFTIGAMVGACILAGGPITGASMNPARSLGPAMCGWYWEMFWAYVVGPMAGATAAAVAYAWFTGGAPRGER